MLTKYEIFKQLFHDAGFEVTEEQYRQFDVYAEQLVDWNNKINLTGITDPQEIAIKHFLDSVLPLKFLDVPKKAAVIDVGTGAGFPGVPMKILRPDIDITLLDSLNKRVNFLAEACKAADVTAKFIHGRAEESGHNENLREKFDIAAARAVAAIPVLAEYCLPFVKVGGIFAAMKGPNENYKEGEQAIKLLGGEITDVKGYSLPGGDKRVLITVKKISGTADKYPRNGGQISKKPL